MLLQSFFAYNCHDILVIPILDWQQTFSKLATPTAPLKVSVIWTACACSCCFHLLALACSNTGYWFGVSGKALDWFKSYLTGRSQRIKIGSCLSSRSDLSLGVSQGSVLGPLLHTLYTTPLSNLISGHAIPHQLYADDHHHYVPSVVNRSAVMDLHRSRSCATLIQSLYDIFCPFLDVIRPHCSRSPSSSSTIYPSFHQQSLYPISSYYMSKILTFPFFDSI